MKTNSNKMQKQAAWSREQGGLTYTVTLQGLLAFLGKEEPKFVPVSEIKHLSSVFRNFERGEIEQETLKRVSLVDVREPIILLVGPSGVYEMLIDGHHRVLRALMDEREEVLARVLNLSNSPQVMKIVFG